MRFAFTLLNAAAIGMSSLPLHAQEIEGVNVSAARVPAGIPTSIQVTFNLAGVSRPYCGLEIRFGDGSSQSFRPGLNGPQDFPVNVTHTYKSPGQYSVAVEGKFVNRGLNSAGACNGPVKNILVTVFDEAAERAASEVTQKERELTAKQAELERLADQLEREKKSQALKEQQLREKELAIREKELAAKEKALRQKELQQKSLSANPVTTKPNPSPPEKSSAVSTSPTQPSSSSAELKKAIEGF